MTNTTSDKAREELETILREARAAGYMVDTSISFDTLERAIAALQSRPAGEVVAYQVAPKGTELWRDVSKRSFDDYSDFPGYRDSDWKRRKLYTAPPAVPAVPEGFVLVPVEPTDAMLQLLNCYDEETLRERYAAMLTAAQEATDGR